MASQEKRKLCFRVVELKFWICISSLLSITLKTKADFSGGFLFASKPFSWVPSGRKQKTREKHPLSRTFSSKYTEHLWTESFFNTVFWFGRLEFWDSFYYPGEFRKNPLFSLGSPWAIIHSLRKDCDNIWAAGEIRCKIVKVTRNCKEYSFYLEINLVPIAALPSSKLSY